ncbi:DedA family protein [Aliihoeflea sp. PC F10.4]
MSDILTDLIGRFGLFALFIGCVVEGETAALAAGFLAHQKLVNLFATFPAVFAGALIGDTAMFLAGRRWANHSFVRKLRERPGFSHAARLVRTHPNSFVFFNRYIYGMRTVGAVTAGLSDIPVARYVTVNAASCVLWTFLFVGLGYFIGLGAERFVGGELRSHEKLIGAAVLILISAAAFSLISRRVRGRRDQVSAG